MNSSLLLNISKLSLIKVKSIYKISSTYRQLSFKSIELKVIKISLLSSITSLYDFSYRLSFF